MAVRINRIKVNRYGPLKEDFELEPGDLNLIYGKNETGKTYIVETLINLLFKTGRGSPAKWSLKEWDYTGTITVSGLEKKSVTFTKTSRKLEDYWQESNRALPQDLSRLLVVRAGNTSLSEESGGISKSILKDYLSGEGILDKIEKNISTTIQNASIEDQIIDGRNQGEIRNHKTARDNLQQLDNLLKEVNQGYTTGTINALQQERNRLETKHGELKEARRYYAFQLREKLNRLKDQVIKLPDEGKCTDIEKEIAIFKERNDNRLKKEKKLEELESSSVDYTWVEKVLTNYQEIMNRQQARRTNPIFLILAVIFFSGAVISGFIDQKWGLGIGAMLAFLFFGLHLSVRSRRRAEAGGDNAELEKIKVEFRKRFGKLLTDRASIQNQQDVLKEAHIQAGQLRKDLEILSRDVEKVESSISTALEKYGNADLTPADWEKEVDKLKSSRISLENEIISTEKKFVALNIPQDQLIKEDPGLKWDSAEYAGLETEMQKIQDKLDEEKKKLDNLKSRVAQETKSSSTESWEDLLTALQQKRAGAASEYRKITAEILGKIQVYKALQEFRRQETDRIQKGLQNKDLIEPLYAITGRYNRINLEGDELYLSSRDEENYPLSGMSTGVSEQVCLALRICFASIGLKGEQAFLILDDAFQHSDWSRRENLIKQVLSLVKNNWQVFYFTMDDNIRDLFLAAGSKEGVRFKSLEL